MKTAAVLDAIGDVPLAAPPGESVKVDGLYCENGLLRDVVELGVCVVSPRPRPWLCVTLNVVVNVGGCTVYCRRRGVGFVAVVATAPGGGGVRAYRALILGQRAQNLQVSCRRGV